MTDRHSSSRSFEKRHLILQVEAEMNHIVIMQKKVITVSARHPSMLLVVRAVIRLKALADLEVVVLCVVSRVEGKIKTRHFLAFVCVCALNVNDVQAPCHFGELEKENQKGEQRRFNAD